MQLPTFSPWLHWDNRDLSEQLHGPGVYLLGRFEESPPDVVDPHDRRILLIAETHGQTLQKRWDQFQYSAFKGGSGHAGGWTFHQLYCNGSDSATPPWLYVSAASVPSDTTDVQGYVQSVKNQLLEEYKDRFGLLPCCNIRGPIESPGPVTPAVTDAARDSSTFPEASAPVEEPSVIFSRWCPWGERESLEGILAAGVYALACFDGPPPSEVDVFDQRIVYIGETCDNSLVGRLWQFNRSAFQGKDGHSGGWSFRSRCAGRGEHLHVSIFPISTLHEPYRSAFIRYTERRLLWHYVLKWGQRPLCNSK